MEADHTGNDTDFVEGTIFDLSDADSLPYYIDTGKAPCYK